MLSRRFVAVIASALALTACTTSQPSAAPTQAAAGKPSVPTPDPAQVEQGKQLVAQKGCGGCHTIPGIAGATGTTGPNLGGVASRTTIAGGAVPNNGPDDLKKWLMNPPGVKPGTAMPNLGLTDQDATSIVALLETLR